MAKNERLKENSIKQSTQRKSIYEKLPLSGISNVFGLFARYIIHFLFDWANGFEEIFKAKMRKQYTHLGRIVIMVQSGRNNRKMNTTQHKT